MSQNAVWVATGVVVLLLVGVGILLAFEAGENAQQREELVLQVRDLQRAVDRLEANAAELRESISAVSGRSPSSGYFANEVNSYGAGVRQASYRSSSGFSWSRPGASCARMAIGSSVEIVICESR